MLNNKEFEIVPTNDTAWPANYMLDTVFKYKFEKGVEKLLLFEL